MLKTPNPSQTSQEEAERGSARLSLRCLQCWQLLPGWHVARGSRHTRQHTSRHCSLQNGILGGFGKIWGHYKDLASTAGRMEGRVAERPGTAHVILQAAGKIPPCEAPAPRCLCWVGAEPGAVMQCCLLSPLLTARWEAPGFLRASWCQRLSFPPAIPLLFPTAVMPGAASLGEFPLLCILASCHLLAAAMDELPPCCTACHCKACFPHSFLSPILHGPPRYTTASHAHESSPAPAFTHLSAMEELSAALPSHAALPPSLHPAQPLCFPQLGLCFHPPFIQLYISSLPLLAPFIFQAGVMRKPMNQPCS